MRRAVIYIALMGAALMLPVRRMDVGKLIPVETLFLYAEGDGVVLETDTGNIGKGGTVKEAAEDLRESAPGYLYLDTADYLLVEPGMEEYLAQMMPYLKPSAGVCIIERGIDLPAVTAYLEAHKPETSIQDAIVTGAKDRIWQNGNQHKRMKICNTP